MTASTFYAHKTPDGLKFEREALYNAYVAGLKPDARYEVHIKRYRPKRTDNQNRYYWSAVVPAITEELAGVVTEQTKQETHDGLRARFLTVQDERLPRIRSTTGLTTVEFNAYIDEIVLWAAEWLHIVIPPPEYREEI